MILYNVCLLFVFLVSLPSLLWRLFFGKKFPGLWQRLGFFLPPKTKRYVVWCHSVSVGEVKALSGLYPILRENFPEAAFLITTVTQTGQMEARKSFPNADFVLYLPFDFSFVIKTFIQHFQPKVFVLVEGDVWPCLIKLLKKNQTKLFLVSAKLSERSFRRWMKFSYFAKNIFGSFDHICAQTPEYLDRFSYLVGTSKNLAITGNLKLDGNFLKGFNLPKSVNQKFLTISCTHKGEEEQILTALENSPFQFFLAPRHPERFAEVARLLKRLGISFCLLSEILPTLNDLSLIPSRVILVDMMGKLPICYENSILAIVGGSFIPHVGGHNVLEPIFYGIASLFGPYTFTQKEFVQYVLKEGLGAQTSYQQIAKDVAIWSSLENNFHEKSRSCLEKIQGSSLRTWNEISKKI